MTVSHYTTNNFTSAGTGVGSGTTAYIEKTITFTAAAGDLIIAGFGAENKGTGTSTTIATTGGSTSAWTTAVAAGTNNADASGVVGFATVTTGGSITVAGRINATSVGFAMHMGGEVWLIPAADWNPSGTLAIGLSFHSDTDGKVTVTPPDNSFVFFFGYDWNASAIATNAGTPSGMNYGTRLQDGGTWSVFTGYWTAQSASATDYGLLGASSVLVSGGVVWAQASSGGGTAASGTGALSLSASTGAQAPAAATASMGFGGSAGGQAPVAAATGAMSLSATGTGSTGGSGAMSLSASGSGNASAAGSGAISLSGSATGSTRAIGSVSLGASAAAAARSTGSGAISLSASATVAGPGVASGSGAMSLNASGGAAAVASSSGSLSLTASGAASALGGGSGSISLTSAATGSTGGTGAFALTGSAAGSSSNTGSGTGAFSVSMAVSVTLWANSGRVVVIGTASWSEPAAGSGAVSLSAAATITLASGAGALDITASSGTGSGTSSGMGLVTLTSTTGTYLLASGSGHIDISSRGVPDIPPAGEIPEGVLPVVNLTTQQVLYGSRTTSYRFELLAHDHVAGTDSLVGYLDGVLPGSNLSWAKGQKVRGTGVLKVADLATAQPGSMTIGAVNLTTIRIRPVLVIAGLPDIPLGCFAVSKAPETWSDETRIYELQLLDRTTMLDQDQVDAAYTAVTTSSVMSQIVSLCSSANENFVPDNNTQALATPMVWPIGTTKLQIVNDLLAALNYYPLTVAGNGTLQTSPYVLPSARTITYSLLNSVPRQLIDGPSSIYGPDWNRDRDVFSVPNKVVTVGAASGSAAPLTGVYTNTDPTSPFSYAARGNRWMTQTIQNVNIPQDTTANQTAFLNSVARATLIAQSSPVATVTVNHLPLPLQIDDVIEFASTPAGIDARHVVVGLQLDLTPTGLMQSSLQEVIDL